MANSRSSYPKQMQPGLGRSPSKSPTSRPDKVVPRPEQQPMAARPSPKPLYPPLRKKGR